MSVRDLDRIFIVSEEIGYDNLAWAHDHENGVCQFLDEPEPLMSIQEDEFCSLPGEWGEISGIKAKTGQCLEIVHDYQVVIVLWGREVSFRASDFCVKAKVIRTRLISEISYLENCVKETLEFHKEIRDEQWIVGTLSHIFALRMPPSLDELERIQKEIHSLKKRVLDQKPIDIDNYRAVGLEIQALRHREKTETEKINGSIQKSIEGAGTGVAMLQVTENLSALVIKTGGQILFPNGPFRQAGLELSFLLARSGAASFGTWWATDEGEIAGKEILKATTQKILAEFPAILVDLVMSLFKVLPGYDKGLSKRVQGCAEAFVEACLSFIVNIMFQAFFNAKALTRDWLINELVLGTEKCLMELVFSFWGIDGNKLNPTRREQAEFITKIIICVIVEEVLRTYLESREIAEKEKRDLGDVILEKLPSLILNVFKGFLSKFTAIWMKHGFDQNGQRIRKDPQEVLSELKGEFDNEAIATRKALKNTKSESEKDIPEPEQVSVGPIDNSKKAVLPLQGGLHADPDLIQTPIRKKTHTRKKSPKTRKDTSSEENPFTGKGPYGIEDYEAAFPSRHFALIRELRKAKHLSKPDGESNPNIAAEEFLRSCKKFPKLVTIQKGKPFYKLVPRDKNGNSETPYSSGFYLSKKQLETARSNPKAIKHVLLALPEGNWADSYDVYKTITKKEAIVFIAPLANTQQGNVLQTGGRIKTAKTGQIFIPNDLAFSPAETDGPPIETPPQTPFRGGVSPTLTLVQK